VEDTSRSSKCGDVIETCQGDNLVAPDQDPGAIAADPEPDRVVDVNLAGCGTITKVMEVRITQFQELGVAAYEGPQANVSGLEVDHHDFPQQ
jgi:hypothetical protein